MCGPHLCTRFKQVDVLHLMQLRPLFQGIAQQHPQCVIQLKTIVGALVQLSNEHKILLGRGKDKQIIIKAGVHLIKVAEMLRFINKEWRCYRI